MDPFTIETKLEVYRCADTAVINFGRWRLLLSRTGATQLFDRQEDPRERKDLAPECPATVAYLRKLARRAEDRRSLDLVPIAEIDVPYGPGEPAAPVKVAKPLVLLPVVPIEADETVDTTMAC